MMYQLFNKLERLGFKKESDNLYSLQIKETLRATHSTWEIFTYTQDNKYYFSDNGNLLLEFDAPDIDIVFMLKSIKYEIGKLGCFINNSKIVKQINIDDIEQDLSDFIQAIHKVDNMYTNL
ncbi:MAG: hypothetical protein E7356_01895 [Clostridiales bacterium]|nr:hypothetical protein [Clostridiales bacterium]